MMFFCAGCVVRLLAFLMAWVILLGSGSADAEKDTEAVCEVRMACVEKEGMIELTLGFECSGGLCGVLLDVSYDDEAFLLLSGGFCGGEGMFFLHSDRGGVVSVLIDGAENSDGKMAVNLYFGRVEGYVGGGSFEASSVEAYRFSDMGEVCFVEVIGEKKCEIGEVKAAEEADDGGAVWISEVECIRGDGGLITVTVRGGAKRGFFAAGTRIFAVDLESGRSEDLYAVGVLANDGLFEWHLPISFSGAVSLVVTPIAYDRSGAYEGEKVKSAEFGTKG